MAEYDSRVPRGRKESEMSRGGNKRRPRVAPRTPVPLEDCNMTATIVEQLASLQYDCASCLEVIRHEQPVWHCLGCFRIFHFTCIKKWACQEESGAGRSFRCPHCQAPQKPVTRCRCFCDRVSDPKYDPMLSCPHSCGGTCGRRRANGCPHPCPNQCHPGPCPECPATAPAKRCPCGRTSYTYRCGKPDPKTTCGGTCSKPLSCGSHTCKQTCHTGPCPPCDIVRDVSCICGKTLRSAVPCDTSTFHCNEPCGRKLRCGKHECDVVCHSGADCPPCDRDPSLVCTCPCGKQLLTSIAAPQRLSCDDRIPTCPDVCGRVLSCGKHYCSQLCHDSPCAPCDQRIQAHCPCRSSMAKVLCRELDQLKCAKKCKTQLTCGKHECDRICCAHRNDVAHEAHRCARTCGKKLLCGHTCMESCHRGACPPCPSIITTPLVCRCGVEVMMPPLPCGTQPPACRLPCLAERQCGHPAGDHACHHGECPPCVKPVNRMCSGGHKMLSNVLCSAAAVFCTEVCGKENPCHHSCSRLCHDGPCVTFERPCSSTCGAVLPCGHGCLQKCHPGSSCGKCQTVTTLRCKCGRKSADLSCVAYLKRIEVYRNGGGGGGMTLDCDGDCFHQNRLAALQSVNAAAKASSGDSKSIYSIRLWGLAEASVDFVKMMEERLAEFLGGTDVSLMLPAMPKDKRAVVHELCFYYHVHTEALDVEPNRTILISKTVRSCIPHPKLSDAITKNRELNPSAYVASVLAKPAEAQKRVIVFEGQRLTELQVQRCLAHAAGDFVTIEPADAELLEPRRVSSKREEEEMLTFYAIFLPHRVKSAYEQLRQRGCAVLYHLLGFPCPPKHFSWEPTRPAGPVYAASVHRDPKELEASLVRREGGEREAPAAAAAPPAAAASTSWSNLVQQRQGSNAKARKEQENAKVEVANRFSRLRQ